MSVLPDGSWPLSSVRSKIFDTIYKLPAQVDHLRATRLGRTLAILQTSKSEFPKNKKMIQLIKDKWSRIICTIPVDYSHLEQCERSYVNIPLYEKREEQVNEKVIPKLSTSLTTCRFLPEKVNNLKLSSTQEWTSLWSDLREWVSTLLLDLTVSTETIKCTARSSIVRSILTSSCLEWREWRSSFKLV